MTKLMSVQNFTGTQMTRPNMNKPCSVFALQNNLCWIRAIHYLFIIMAIILYVHIICLLNK